MKNKSESGIAHLILVLVIVAVVAVVGIVGLRVVQKQNAKVVQPATSTQPVAKDTVPATITSAADLNSAQASLNQDNLDSDLNSSSLDSDVNSLL
jgi:flagellar basal body-associated protein FliL